MPSIPRPHLPSHLSSHLSLHRLKSHHSSHPKQLSTSSSLHDVSSPSSPTGSKPELVERLGLVLRAHVLKVGLLQGGFEKVSDLRIRVAILPQRTRLEPVTQSVIPSFVESTLTIAVHHSELGRYQAGHASRITKSQSRMELCFRYAYTWRREPGARGFLLGQRPFPEGLYGRSRYSAGGHFQERSSHTRGGFSRWPKAFY